MNVVAGEDFQKLGPEHYNRQTYTRPDTHRDANERIHVAFGGNYCWGRSYL